MGERTRDAEFSDYVAAQRVRLVRAARLLTTGDDAAAEDLVRTTLTRPYVHWSRVSRADDPVAYGYRSLTNACAGQRHVRAVSLSVLRSLRRTIVVRRRPRRSAHERRRGSPRLQ